MSFLFSDTKIAPSTKASGAIGKGDLGVMQADSGRGAGFDLVGTNSAGPGAPGRGFVPVAHENDAAQNHENDDCNAQYFQHEVYGSLCPLVTEINFLRRF